MDEISVYSDGGSRGNPGPGACAFVVISEKKVHSMGSKYLGFTTNNIAEYEGVILALNWLAENIKSSSVIYFFVDSLLVYSQLTGRYKIKNSHIKTRAFWIKNIEKKIPATIIYQHVPRDKNKLADKLVNKELDKI